MELSDKLSEAENIAQAHILDYKARNELDKEGYGIWRHSKNKLVITNDDTTILFGHGIKGVYYFSVDKLYTKMFSEIAGTCELKNYITKIELNKGEKELHIGFNSKNQIYTSYSERYKGVRKKMLECAEFYKK